MATQYLAVSADVKTRKGEKHGFLTGILYLAPGNVSGREFCPNRTPGCSRDCLFTAGKGVMAPVYAGRLRKSLEFSKNPALFVHKLAADIAVLVRRAKRKGLTPLVRLNGTSDLPWENLGIMARFPEVQFYDYTKSFGRMNDYRDQKFPPNYHLTFSRSETNEQMCLDTLLWGGNVAVVFSTRKGEALPTTWHGYPVIDGDVDDVRPLDPRGVVIGLRAKGKARKSSSGFVVKV
jgi:hypothetical protein